VNPLTRVRVRALARRVIVEENSFTMWFCTNCTTRFWFSYGLFSEFWPAQPITPLSRYSISTSFAATYTCPLYRATGAERLGLRAFEDKT